MLVAGMLLFTMTTFGWLASRVTGAKLSGRYLVALGLMWKATDIEPAAPMPRV
ncbi:hypothetical protein D9M72_648240 [compost metagenome]